MSSTVISLVPGQPKWRVLRNTGPGDQDCLHTDPVS